MNITASIRLRGAWKGVHFDSAYHQWMLISSLVVQCGATMNVFRPFIASTQQINRIIFNDFETASHHKRLVLCHSLFSFCKNSFMKRVECLQMSFRAWISQCILHFGSDFILFIQTFSSFQFLFILFHACKDYFHMSFLLHLIFFYTFSFEIASKTVMGINSDACYYGCLL